MAILKQINKIRRVRMLNIPNQIIKVAEKYNLKLPNDRKDMTGDVWCIGNNFILKHDALTKIAKNEGVVFHKPEVHIIYNDKQFFGVAMYGEAELDGYKIWTTADSTTQNTMAKYYFNMAEKRLRDRQVLKLLDLYEYGLYSDVEADDFKKQASTTTKATDYMKNNIRQIIGAKGEYKKDKAESIFRDIGKEDAKKIKDLLDSGKVDYAIREFYKLGE